MRSRRREYERRQRARTGAKKKPVVLAAIVFVLVAVVVALIFVIPKIWEALSSRELPAGDGSAIEERVEVLGESDDATGKENHFDAEQYYRENATLLDICSVGDGDMVLTGREVAEEAAARGFLSCDITAEFSKDGKVLHSENPAGGSSIVGMVVSESDDKFPSYSIDYISASGEWWRIFITNGCYIAKPIYFNFESDLDVNVVFSESESLTYYDSYSNKFYKVVPFEENLIVRVLERIDADALDGLGTEEILGYVEKGRR